jgi:hypothetical protein
MPTGAALDAFIQLLATKTGLKVAVGRPEAGAGVFVWPWRITENTNLKNHKPPPGSELSLSPRVLSHNIHILIYVRPELTPDELTGLDSVQRAIAENPIFLTNGGQTQVQLVSNEIPDEVLTAIHLAAGVQLSLCLGAILRLG